jgi:site-specific recombinase XerD
LFSEKEEAMARPASRVSRVLMTGPLAAFADAYAAELRARGYAPLTTVNELRQVGRLSGWLDASGLSAADLNRERVEAFLVWQRAGGRHRAGWSRPGLVCLLDVLRGLGVLTAEEPAPAGSPTDPLLARFERYLLTERGLATGTVGGYVRHARRFLDGLTPGRGLGGLTAAEVTGAVLDRASAGVSVSATQYFVSGLRAFLRFCFVEGLTEVDLSPAALVVTGRRRSSLPKAISRADAVALLGSCDRRRTLGRRDYALIITLLRLGLRRGEVARLTLDDIDWRAGELVVRGKGGRADRLPLPADVGEAITSYLRRGRPASDRREVFLRARAPFEPIAPGTVSSTVRRACRRAAIAEVGSHRLRHTTACEMVSAHVPLQQVGQVLRHRSLQSTAIYARVDLDQLRLLATPWPGSARR